MRTGIDLRTTPTPFSGGSGTLPSGELSERTARFFGQFFAAIGAACGIWFLFQVGWVLIPILLIGAVCVLGYTDFLTRIGVGEIAAGMGLGAGPVIGTALVQNGELGSAATAAAVPAFLMTFNLLLLNEFPDEAADRRGGRRHLVIRFGRKSAAKIYAAAALGTPLSIIMAVVVKALPGLCLLGALPSLLLLKPLLWSFKSPEEPVPIPALAANVIWIQSTNLVLAATLWGQLWRQAL